MRSTRPWLVLAVLAGAVVLACSSTSARPTEAPPPDAAASPSSSQVVTTVPQGYEPPKDRVAFTGATIPVNGKPTLVFVDAIW